ncbi:MAG: hypothetical protein ACXVXN_03870 [Mycobacteriaceae bacterium]
MSMVASSWPAATLSPTATSTLVTVPDTVNVAEASLTGATVPVSVSSCSTFPVVAATVR